MIHYLSNFYLKTIIVSVINDLVTDQRVHKSCLALLKSGYQPILIGRMLPTSLPMPERPYKYKRMHLLFTKGPFFYAEYNIRLFFYLLFHRSKALMSNDLDTLLPNFIISRFRRIPLIYDSHEYFTETPELVHRKSVQKVWKMIEAFVLKRLDRMITVNESIADLFRRKYGIIVSSVRNIPSKQTDIQSKTREEAGIPENKSVLILQGSGINIDRGAEELVMAMEYLSESVLLIIGNGDAMPLIRQIVQRNNLSDRIIILPRMNYSEMMSYTKLADLGFTLDKDTNLNYRFSLPNKLFDYIHAGVPVIATPLPEIRKIIDEFQIGTFAESLESKALAYQIRDILNQPELIRKWKNNLVFAAETLCWEKEEEILLQFYREKL
jgi:glycosyltransferase involved in cell wall biosynthesis